MKDAAKRPILPWMHIVFGVPVLGYIYSPFEKLPDHALATRFVFVPVMVVSKLWMWKEHVFRRLVSKKSAPQRVAVSRFQHDEAQGSHASIATY